MCGSVKLGEEESKGCKDVWWNDKVKPVAERLEAAWREVLGARDEGGKERSMEAHKKGKRNIKWCIYQTKIEVNEQLF